MTFDQWVDLHCVRFGLTTEAELRMVQSWGPAFAAAGFNVEDLLEATNYMTTRAAPQFRSDHLRLIQQRINDRARAASAKLLAEPEDAETSTCDQCGNTAWVIVPHPRFIDAGQWLPPQPTAAVVCDACAKGRKVLSQFAAPIPEKLSAEDRRTRERLAKSYILSHYTRDFPRWREMLAQRDEARAAMSEAARQAGVVDKTLGRIQWEVADSTRLPR